MSERERGSRGLLTLAEIREIDLIGYLSELGFEPVKVHSADHWYLSPLRDERTASFKVNRRLNRWYDRGISLGGNLIDFATIFYQCSVGEVIKTFSDYWSFHRPKILLPSTEKAAANCPIQVLYTGQLTSKTLLDYIVSRSVSPDIARQYCRQVNYQMGDRRYFEIGLLNNSGGYELRNSYSKLASSPKDITTINVGALTVSMFEGMFDFLSYKTLMRKMTEQPENYVILNSISLRSRTTFSGKPL
ncbi:DNA primase [Dyadobacter sp. CY351]|uniref:DNA primase n=1 Tax=Dyadobacter sp. CY351 TaxID=2909337 RepID=UPI001F44136C|nr:DNA primase [Dyadobacter sp. CY351]MCF2519062.1 DNA primase [Dyadobacter sp. CY351]